MNIPNSRNLRYAVLHSAAAVALLAVVACATVPTPPSATLQAAEVAIANAEQARAAEYAAPELSAAREELTAARTAAQQDHLVLAGRLAEEARAGAELASAKAEAAKAQAVNDEMRASIETLKQEMQRNQGVR